MAAAIQDFPDEIWKPVVGHPHYEVSNYSRVRSVARTVTHHTRCCGKPVIYRFKGKLLSVLLRPDGRPVVALGHGRQFLVYRLMLEAFVGPCPKGMEACHNDGNPGNNKLANLRWDTRSANEFDKVLHGAIHCGERHWNAKLSDAQVADIRAAVKSGSASQIALATRYRVSPSHISKLCCGSRRHG